mmetsp:Transcript_63610/g.150695  ORF Transcript_63610/g.150695 Transcript_63610/m.150695 type:complete len:238 (-) Transcript_63610:65-778(-)
MAESYEETRLKLVPPTWNPTPVTVAQILDDPKCSPDGRRPAFLMRGMLSPEESAYFIEEATKLGMEDSGYPHHYRCCDRVSARADTGVAEELWRRFIPYAFDFEDTQGCVWRPFKLNPVFRIVSYNENGHFAPHYDGGFRESADVQSFLTFMLYLNDDFEGGATNFLRPHSQRVRDAESRLIASDTDVVSAVKPETGACVVFKHDAHFHEGQRLGPGAKKWIMRSEVMFRRLGADEK